MESSTTTTELGLQGDLHWEFTSVWLPRLQGREKSSTYVHIAMYVVDLHGESSKDATPTR